MRRSAWIILATVITVGCGEYRDEARAEVLDRAGDRVGIAELVEYEDGVSLEFRGHNLPPGMHGFHIHETGACEPPDFASAGPHFDPTLEGHGRIDVHDGHHVGDLPNLEVLSDGTAHYQWFIPGVSLYPNVPMSLLHEGRTALVIHAGVDDGVTNPAGNAGPRIACGVIERD